VVAVAAYAAMFAFYFVDATKLDGHRGVLAHRPSPLLAQQVGLVHLGEITWKIGAR
jgi:hypothetical protein